MGIQGSNAGAVRPLKESDARKGLNATVFRRWRPQDGGVGKPSWYLAGVDNVTSGRKFAVEDGIPAEGWVYQIRYDYLESHPLR